MDLQRIKDLIALMQQSGVSELALELPDYKITVKREPSPADRPAPHLAPAQPLPLPADLPDAAPSALVTVSAPMVGIFYLGGAGDARLPLQLGAPVEQGQVVAAIESMKVPNEIFSPATGRIEEILVADGSPVEFGQPLLLIRPQEVQP